MTKISDKIRKKNVNNCIESGIILSRYLYSAYLPYENIIKCFKDITLLVILNCLFS